MLVKVKRRKVKARLFQIRLGGIEAQLLHDGYYAGGCLGKRSVPYEESFPDQIRLLGPGQCPKLRRAHRGRAEQFCHQIVIGQKFVNPPPAQPSETGRKQMGVNVNHRDPLDRLLDVSP